MCVDYTDLNKACPKDAYPLPSIDGLVDGASEYKLLSFMDAYSSYNQIRMSHTDAEKTAFMTGRSNYCYQVMPFGLKNAGATYQRLMDRIFEGEIGRTIEVYVDDMVVKSETDPTHIGNLAKIFKLLEKHSLRLNPDKCSFGVQAGEFLGYVLTHRGIEANPSQCRAIIYARSPAEAKEVQILAGQIGALSRFLGRSADKIKPLFQLLRKNTAFRWTEECEKALQDLRRYLATPPILTAPKQGTPLLLYLAVSKDACSAVLVQEQEGTQSPVYYISRMWRGAEQRYQKIEKAAYAVVLAARKLRHYFQSHSIIVKTDMPIRQVLAKPDLAGRMVAWSIELSEFDIKYVPRGSVKAQALADFIAELVEDEAESVPELAWTLSVDGSSNTRGSGAGVTLEGPDGVLLEQSLRFNFKATNNQAEYEALIAGMLLTADLGVKHLKVRSDSLLITGQVTDAFSTRDELLGKYYEKVQALKSKFISFELTHVPREQNGRADILAKLASTKKPGNNHSVIQETLSEPSVNKI